MTNLLIPSFSVTSLYWAFTLSWTRICSQQVHSILIDQFHSRHLMFQSLHNLKFRLPGSSTSCLLVSNFEACFITVPAILEPDL